MKKICILQNDLAYGGTDTFVINLCHGLTRDGYNVTIILCADEDKYIPRIEELQRDNVTVLRTCSLIGGVRSKLRHLILLYQLLKKGHYHVFQTNIDLFNGPQLFIARLAGIPIRECHSHNSRQEREVQYGGSISIRVYQYMMRKLCWRFSNRRGGCSDKAMDFLFQDKWRRDPNSMIIYNGIDISSFQTEINRDLKLKDIGSSAKYHILTVGRISSQKNPFFLVDIFSSLCMKNDSVDLLWVGIGNLQGRVEERLTKLGIRDRVHFLGSRQDVNELMKVSDAFLLPSQFEGLGIVIIEAQAAGLPCIISDTIPQMVDCGGCEFHSLQESPENWARCLQKIIEGKRKYITDQKKLSNYSINNMVSQMECLIQD